MDDRTAATDRPTLTDRTANPDRQRTSRRRTAVASALVATAMLAGGTAAGGALASAVATHRPRPAAHRTAAHRPAAHRTAAHRTAAHRTAAHRTAARGSAASGSAAHRSSPAASTAPAAPACAHPSSSAALLTETAGGAVRGCWLVGVHPVGAYTVALSGAPGGWLGGAAVGQGASVTLSPPSGRPGAAVTIDGRLSAPIPANQAQATADVCFDGCQGLVDDAAPVRWQHGTPGVPAGMVERFSTVAHVPLAPFFVGVRLHGLVSGTYPIGVGCLGPTTSGCALHPAQGSAPFRLAVPHPIPCRPVGTCTALHLSPASGPPGTAVAVTGFAPLTLLTENEPFGYQLSVHPAAAGAGSAGAGSAGEGSAGQAAGGTSLTLAPTRFQVTAPMSWSSVARTRPVRSETTGPAPGPISQDQADPAMVARCVPGAVDLVSVATGAVVGRVPTAGVAAATLPGHLHWWPGGPAGPGRPAAACVDVLAAGGPGGGPGGAAGGAPGVVLAAFTAAPPEGAPPVYDVAVASTDGGRTWRALPVPAGAGPGTFSGFAAAPDHAVVARFSSSGASGSPVELEERSTDGLHWHPASVGCPAVGPCLRLGPYAPGNCAMNGTFQDLLTSGITPGRLAPITGDWPAPLDACGPGQLVATSPTSALVVQSTSPFLVTATTDGGRRFVDVGLPPLTVPNGTAPLGQGGSFPAGNGGGLLLLPDGSLLETTGTLPALAGQQAARPAAAAWHLLRPGATAWCAVGPLEVRGARAAAGTPISPPVAAGGRLWWQDQAAGSTGSGGLTSTAGVSCPGG